MNALQRLWQRLVRWTDADVDVDVFSRLRVFLGIAAVCKSIGLVSPLPRLAQGLFSIGLPAHRYADGGTFPPALGAWWSWWPAASNELYRGVEVAALVFAVLMTLGVLSRLSTLLTGLCALWLLVVDPAGFKHNLFALGVFCVLLPLAPCGAGLSIDALLRRRFAGSTTTTSLPPPPNPRSPVPGEGGSAPVLSTTTTWALPLVLIQLQVGVIYLFSTLRKLNDGWSTGHLLRTSIESAPAALAKHGLQFLEPLVTFTPIYVVGAWLTLLVEGFLVFGFYWRRTRPWALFLGVGLHLWIDLALDVGAYSLVMFAMYIAFIEPTPRGHVVALPARHRLRRLLLAFDWLARFSRTDSADEHLRVVDTDGVVVAEDVDAALFVLRRLPLTFLPAFAIDVVRRWRRRRHA